MVAASSSAPILPCFAKASDSLVNPEMSTKASVPSTSLCRSSGVSATQSTTRRGRYGRENLPPARDPLSGTGSTVPDSVVKVDPPPRECIPGDRQSA